MRFDVHGLRKDYDGKPILGPLDLTIAPGETTVLLGPSGCGKSTLLRLLLGLISADAGTILVDGESPSSWQTVRQRIGTVVQDGGLFPHFSAARNISIVARHLGWDEARIRPRLHELAAMVRLPESSLQRFPHQLSGGQKQRVALMRALMLSPQALLLDEPLGALDPIVRADLQTDLRAIIRELKMTVILVTHDLGEAVYFADRVLLMQAGNILQDGSARDLFDRPAAPFVTQFVQAQRLADFAGERS